jgi:hypothetical protein
MEFIEEIMIVLPVDVQLTVVGQIIVDDKGHLLHVNTTSPNVGGDQDSAGA